MHDGMQYDQIQDQGQDGMEGWGGVPNLVCYS